MFDKRRNDAGEGQSAGSGAGAASAFDMPNQGAGQAGKAFISSTITVKGELSGNEDVVVAGHFEGEISLPSQSLTVTQSGRVRADIRANVVEIQGELIGDVEGMDKVLITPTGRMQGNIKSPRVILDDGAQFKGSIDMEPTPAPKQTPRPAAPKPQQDMPAGQRQGEPAQRRGASA